MLDRVRLLQNVLLHMPAGTILSSVPSGLRGAGRFTGATSSTATNRDMFMYGFIVFGLSQALLSVQLQRNRQKVKENVSALGGTMATMEEELKTANEDLAGLKAEIVTISEGGKAMKQNLGSLTQELEAIDAKLDALLAKRGLAPLA